MLYNMLQILTLEQYELFRNAVIRFSQFQFSLIFRLLQNIFPAHLLMYIADFFVKQERKGVLKFKGRNLDPLPLPLSPTYVTDIYPSRR